jgi:hypothetical protein
MILFKPFAAGIGIAVVLVCTILTLAVPNQLVANALYIDDHVSHLQCAKKLEYCVYLLTKKADTNEIKQMTHIVALGI